MKNYYTKLPKQLFYGLKENKEGYIKSLKDYKVLLILDYLYTNTNRKDISFFTLEDIIISCGFKVDKHKGKSVDQFKSLLNNLKSKKIIECDYDFKDIKSNQIKYIVLNMFDKNKENKDINFIQLYENEKNKILSYNTEKINNVKLLSLYCYLKSRIFYRRTDLIITGGKAECCYPTYLRITKDLRLTEGIIKKYIDILKDLDLIRYGNAGKWYYSSDNRKVVRESANTYVLFKDGWEDELKEGIKGYKRLSKDKIFVKEYKNNNRKINGEKGAIVRLINQGKASQKQIDRLKEINEIKDIKNGKNDIKFKIKALFEQNEEMLLSDIYTDNFEDDLADKYYDLELNLGLIDEDSNLLTDYNYYKWVMENYKKGKHNYFVNCIKKHIKDNKKIYHKGLLIIKNKKIKGIKKYIINKINNNEELKNKFIKQFQGTKFKKMNDKELAEITDKIVQFFINEEKRNNIYEIDNPF